jgi:ATP-dependent DNA helicase PIF1
MLHEISYNMDDLQQYISTNEPLVVSDQNDAYTKILDMVAGNLGGIVFLDAPGGTGKTFVINLLLAKIQCQSKIALAVASSGIASTLLDGGRTAHSAFKLPLNLVHSESPLCNITRGTGTAKVLQECTLIVWDECTMSHKSALEALDRTLQDLRGNHKPMGGIVLVLAADF